MEEKKTVWSLQNDKRTEAERNVFKPTGKQPKNKTLQYIIWVFVAILAASFALTFAQENAKDVCIVSDFCFNSKENIALYTAYIFINIIIVLLAIVVAYIIGKKLGDRFKL